MNMLNGVLTYLLIIPDLLVLTTMFSPSIIEIRELLHNLLLLLSIIYYDGRRDTKSLQHTLANLLSFNDPQVQYKPLLIKSCISEFTG